MEIKDPSFNRGDSIPQMLGKKSHLHKNAEGKVQLMSNHSFYYQIQTQLLVTGFKFCDFLFGLRKILSWKLFVLTHQFKQIF